MEDNDTEELPIIVEGRAVARVIINHHKEEATKSAHAAASHIPTPDDIQFCPFSDGSLGSENHGGVALVYRCPWLPQGWVSEREATIPSGNMVRKAWSYGYAAGSLAMEGVGVLESLYAANEELERHLPALIKHASTVTVKATTDCQSILHYISAGILTTNQARAFPPQVINKIHDLILALQGHGIKVIVELHWCPRNMVPPLSAADAMAGQAMRNGRGYCNVTKNYWSKATQSAIMKELEPMLLGTVMFARPPVDQTSISAGSSGAGSTGTTEKKTAKKTRRGKKQTHRAQAAAEVKPTGAADSHPQLPLPAVPLPSKPTTMPSTKPMASGAAEAGTTGTAVPPKPATMSHSAGPTTSNVAEPTAIPSTKPVASTAADAQPPEESVKAVAGKRKAEDMEESEGRPTKKSKPSKARPIRQQHRPTMPASWALDPETTTIFTSDIGGVISEEPVQHAPFIRVVDDSTKDTMEKNVYINDGVNLFSLIEPMP